MKKAAIVCCSNGQKKANEKDIKALENTLQEMGILPVFSDYIYEKDGVSSGSAKERAKALMDFYKDDAVVEIFDISGGDLANGVLPYLDYEVIAKSHKKFWGYSDLTTIVNAIYAKTGNVSVLYQVRNLLYQHREKQLEDFRNTIMNHTTALYDIAYRFVQGRKMRGVVVGGNIRCLLKLAGTEYMPDFTGKILLLESYSGTAAKMETYLCQLKQLGVFEKCTGVLLGTFTEMEEKECKPAMVELVQRIVGTDMPIAITRDIGHGTDAKAIMIGREYMLEE